MNENERKSIRESDLDTILQESMPETPPEDIIHEVTPWRRAMNRILTGLALNAITLNFLALDYILPAIGLILMLLGFRTLHRENGWIRTCFIITIIRAVYFFPSLILNVIVLQSTVYDLLPSGILTVVSFMLIFMEFFCLWQGFKAVKRKAGLPAEAGAAVGLMVWYLVIAGLAFTSYSGIVIGIIMIVSYIFVIRGLIKLSKELDEAGYVIRTTLVRVSDRILVWVIIAIIAVGILCGYLFGGSYPMEWTAKNHLTTDKTQQISAQLIEMGFPEEVLQDLTEQDILACEGALQVVVDIHDHSVNDGREVVEQSDYTEYHHTVYDTKQLRITGVAVELPSGREMWKIVHHFRWVVDPGFYGTESLQLWPAYRNYNGWDQAEDFTGQVLYTKDGQSYAAPYYSLGVESYTSDSLIWGEQTSTDVFAAFSMPRNGENQRGYVSYAIKELTDGYIIDSWINYTHQRSMLQYPALTAVEKRMTNSWNDAGAFFTVQDALQFFPMEGGAELLG